jgi:hypothetical protein
MYLLVYYKHKNMDLIRFIIREEVSKLISEASHKKEKERRRAAKRQYDDDDERHIENIFKAMKGKYPSKNDKELAIMAQRLYDKEQASKNKKLRLKGVGGTVKLISKDDYERKNVKSSAANAEQIRMRIDQENTDIAAVARKVFPHHTDEGAQSQLRKILNGDRPMTKRVASILSDMISSGQIAVKKD